MNIGIDGRTLIEKKTGIGVYTYNLIKKLNEIDKENNYYIYSNKKIFIDFNLNNNFNLCEYNGKVGTLWLYYALPKILKNDSIDIFLGTQHVLPKRSSSTKGIKFILTIHDLAINKFPSIGAFYTTLIQKMFTKKSCKNADKIIADSISTKNDIIELYGTNSDKIRVIYPGVDKKNIINEVSEISANNIREKFKIENNKFIFFLSTIEPRKNLNTAIKAFEKFCENHKDKLYFVISGKKGWKCEDTFELIENSKYKDRIILTGFITNEEKEFFYKNCECFVYASLYEGFGLPILEAMKHSCIVITSDNSSLPEVGGQAAFYLKNVYDYEELEKLISNVVYMDENERKKIKENGEKQLKKFSWEKCAMETQEYLLSK